jgi:hypothetical protein
MPPKQEQHTLDLNTLTPAELEDLKGTVDSEIRNLAQSVMTLQKAAGEYGSAGRSIERLSEQTNGKTIVRGGSPCRSPKLPKPHVTTLFNNQ